MLVYFQRAMKKRMFLSVSMGVIANILFSIPVRGAETKDLPSQPEYIKIEVRGLVTKIVAIGAETSGYAITAKNVTLELDFQGINENVARIRLVAGSGTPTIVKGTLKKISGIERKDRLVLSVEELTIAQSK